MGEVGIWTQVASTIMLFITAEALPSTISWKQNFSLILFFSFYSEIGAFHY